MKYFKNRQHLLNSFSLGIKFVLVTVFNLLFTKYALKYLGYSNYGYFVSVSSFILVLQFLNTVIISVSTRYLTVAFVGKDYKKIKKEFSSSFDLHILIGVLFILMGFVFSNHLLDIKNEINGKNLDALYFLFWSGLFSGFLNIVSTPFQALLIANEDFFKKSLIEITHSALKFLAIILVSISSDPFSILCYIFPFVSAIASVLFIFIVLVYYKKQLFINFLFNKKILLERFKFGFWISFGALNFLLKSQLLVLLAYFLFGPINGAITSIASQIFFSVWSIVGIYNQAIQPGLTKMFVRGKNTQVLNMMNSNYRSLLLLSFFVLFGFELFGDYVLELWLGIDYPRSLILISELLIISVVFECLSFSIHTIVNAKGQIKRYQLMLSLPLVAIFLICIQLGANIEYFYFSIAINSVLISFLSLNHMRLFFNFSISQYLSLGKDEIIFLLFCSLILIFHRFIYEINFIYSFFSILILSIYLMKILIKSSNNLSVMLKNND